MSSNSVKLSKQTIEILKNYATINSNILIQEGDALKTMAISKSILASATGLSDSFPQEFPVYNLQELLSVISLFKEPELVFDGKILTIQESSGKGMKIRYMASSKEILVYPQKDIKEPKYEVDFDLSAEELENLMKSAAVINGPDIQVVGNADGIAVKATDKKVPTSNDVVIAINEDAQDTEFTFNFRTENLKLIPGRYNVKISSKLLAKFTNQDNPGLVWFVPTESDSTYG